MDKIDKDSYSSSGITFGECNVQHLLFADDLALLSLNKSDLQYALDWFSDACLDAGIKISTREVQKVMPPFLPFHYNGLEHMAYCVFIMTKPSHN